MVGFWHALLFSLNLWLSNLAISRSFLSADIHFLWRRSKSVNLLSKKMRKFLA